MSLYRRVGGLTLLIAVLTLLGWACGGGGGGGLLGGRTTPTPTGTPAIFQRSPVVTASPTAAASPTGSPVASPTAAQSPVPSANVTPVTPFEITVKEAVVIRSAPSDQAERISADNVIYPGFKRKVIGETRGKPVDPAKGDLWYALEGGGFVYAPFVEKIQ